MVPPGIIVIFFIQGVSVVIFCVCFGCGLAVFRLYASGKNQLYAERSLRDLAGLFGIDHHTTLLKYQSIYQDIYNDDTSDILPVCGKFSVQSPGEEKNASGLTPGIPQRKPAAGVK
ncbi:MAG: hypothetical protein ABI863_01715 [Ginsengibacter sp.]